ncbi:MAG: biotin/lipoyl-binding protein [Lentimicrobiaceae bacterium]|nr:biotin/lipoyl-binding protein [Lentimicrobiaceae bacterium]
MKRFKFIFFLLFLTAFLVSCKSKVIETPLSEYKALRVDASDGVVEVEFPTQLQSQQVIEIHPRVEGTLEKVYFKEGTPVRKGELLFQINPYVYQQQALSCQANLYAAQKKLTNAEFEVQKVTPLVEKDIVSNYELVANLMNAQLRLADGRLYDKTGIIDRASGIVNPTTGTVLLKAVFPNPNRDLATGSSGTVIIPLGNLLILTTDSAKSISSKC